MPGATELSGNETAGTAGLIHSKLLFVISFSILLIVALAADAETVMGPRIDLLFTYNHSDIPLSHAAIWSMSVVTILMAFNILAKNASAQ